jgi:hypothetical protein
MHYMDQASAALVGAGIALIGTLGAASLVYVATRRQARDQGGVEHQKRLREERRDAYVAFMESIEPLDRVIFELVDIQSILDNYSLPTVRQAAEDALPELDAAVHALYRGRMSLILLGPDSVSVWAEELWNDAGHLRGDLVDYLNGWLNVDRILESVERVERSKRRFTESANAVLVATP